MSQQQIPMNNDEIRKNTGAETENADSISRRQALQKMGYAAFASSTLFLLLNNPTKVYATSNPTGNPDDDFGGFGGTKDGEAEAPKDPDPWKEDVDPWKQ